MCVCVRFSVDSLSITYSHSVYWCLNMMTNEEEEKKPNQSINIHEQRFINKKTEEEEEKARLMKERMNTMTT